MVMAAQRTVGVRAEIVLVDRGLWCTRCMLSAGIRAWIAMSLGDQMHLQERLACRECGSSAFIEA